MSTRGTTVEARRRLGWHRGCSWAGQDTCLSENRPRPLHYWTGCRTRSRTSSPTSAAWYQLRPPEPDELGLITALREHTDRLTGIGPARPVYLDGLIVTVQAPEELSRCRSGRGRRLSDRGRGAHQRCPTRLDPDGPGHLAWRRTGRQRSHSLSSSSACLVRGAVVTCSCWNRNRSAVLSLTDSVWLPAANTTISCWRTSGST